MTMPLQAIASKDRQTAIIDNLSDLPAEKDSRAASSVWMQSHIGWPLTGVIALSGIVMVYLTKTKEAPSDDPEKQHPANATVISKFWAFIQSLKGTNDKASPSAPPVVHANDPHTIGASCDDPEHHAVVAMYVAKEPNKQS